MNINNKRTKKKKEKKKKSATKHTYTYIHIQAHKTHTHKLTKRTYIHTYTHMQNDWLIINTAKNPNCFEAKSRSGARQYLRNKAQTTTPRSENMLKILSEILTFQRLTRAFFFTVGGRGRGHNTEGGYWDADDAIYCNKSLVRNYIPGWVEVSISNDDWWLEWLISDDWVTRCHVMAESGTVMTIVVLTSYLHWHIPRPENIWWLFV